MWRERERNVDESCTERGRNVDESWTECEGHGDGAGSNEKARKVGMIAAGHGDLLRRGWRLDGERVEVY